jgi:hypothetical protein
MLDPINGYDSPHKPLKMFSFFILKILKIFKRQQQEIEPSAGKSTIATEFVAAASRDKHPKAQKRPSNSRKALKCLNLKKLKFGLSQR